MLIAITGPFGGGKSAVSEILNSLGWSSCSADELCHDIYPEILSELVARWGEEIKTPAGLLDRKKVADIVFDDRAELRFLQDLLYPRLLLKLKNFSQNRQNDFLAVEVPLLFEENMQHAFDYSLCVYAPDEIRIARLAKRGFSPEEMRRRDAAQWPMQKKLEAANFGILNDGSRAKLELQLRILDQRLRKQ